MSRYVTISVPEEVKYTLEEHKGEQEWGDFLIRLLNEAEESKRRSAFYRLRSILTEEDLKAMEKSSKEFRKEFALDETS